MTFATFLTLLVFALVASISPGPNNIMLFASGVNFGFRRTLPHMTGIVVGFCTLVAAVALGLGVILDAEPRLKLALKIAGGAYMLWLAWKIARAGAPDAKNDSARPMTLLEAAAFQWVNPKAWVMGGVAVTTYTRTEDFALTGALVVLAFFLASIPSVLTWAMFGQGMQRFLADPVILRRVNIAMALALVASLWPMLR